MRMITDFDVLIIFGGFFLFIVAMHVKVFFHFEYLKFECGKFRNIDWILSFYFRPWRAFEHLSDLIVILWAPILTRGNGPFRKKVFIWTYVAIALFTVVIGYGSLKLL
jgi:hypothetical protein